ncbi:MAG TPA: glycosyltransferase [Bacteroidota bacterium]|nr:glycosyltransferase [Bacteroidota bacterium]
MDEQNTENSQQSGIPPQSSPAPQPPPQSSPEPAQQPAPQASGSAPAQPSQPAEGERRERQDNRGRFPQRGRQRYDNRRDNRGERQQDDRGRDRGERSGSQSHGPSEISIIVPLYNEEQSLKELYEQIRSALHRSGNYEIIFVDDGSTDGSARVLHDLRHRDKRVKIIRFRRNFGKSAALSVGFQNARGEYVITMDADLQDDPAEIPSLINELKKGYDLVSGWKRKRHDPITKTIPSKFFNAVTSIMTGIKIHDFNCGLKAYRREVVKDLKIYGELHRYIPVLAHWQGFKIGEMQVQHRARKFGKTKFGIGRFWKGFLDLLTALFTTRYLQRPMHLFGFWGFVFFLIGFGIDLYLGIMKFMYGMALSNRPLFTGGILMIIVGIQFISVGLLGEMITKTRLTSTDEYSIREQFK